MSTDPKLHRIWDAYTLGGGPIKPDNLPWRKALAQATAIASTIRESYSPTFERATIGSALKLPMQYVDGYQVPVYYQTILCLETTWAELDYKAEELERLAKDIRDEAFRRRMQQTIEDLKAELERKKRQHLKVVP